MKEMLPIREEEEEEEEEEGLDIDSINRHGPFTIGLSLSHQRLAVIGT
jgi:hypothetical protein